ncbi:hypothetical protein BX616_004980 [Lobosporangium transversale]|nr:hypothetical protein BX616_004980 [Lobosporangium transversale]
MVSSNGSKRETLPHHPSDLTITELHDENTPLLANSSGNSSNDSKNINTNHNKIKTKEVDPTTFYVKTLKGHLPWYKRPSVFWLLPIFGLSWLTLGMLNSSLGQFQAALLCREYINRHSSNVTATTITIATVPSKDLFSYLAQTPSMASTTTTTTTTTSNMISTGLLGLNSLSRNVMIAMRPSEECKAPEIQAFTAKIIAIIEMLTGIASTISVGYYSSLSDRHGRRIVMIVCFLNTLLTLAAIIAMSMYWDQIGLPLMVASSILNGLLGTISLGLTMTLAYTADCTDPAKRSLAFTWVHASLYLGLAIGPFLGGTIVRASGTILTLVYMDVASNALCLLLTILFVPESLPICQSENVQQLYETFKKEKEKEENKNDSNSDEDLSTSSQEHIPWYSHLIHSLRFFKPNGRNTNLILLAVISFLGMLAYRGTLSIIILNLARLLTMIVLIPVLAHFHKKSYEKKQRKVQAKAAMDARRHGKQPTLTTNAPTFSSAASSPQQQVLDSADLSIYQVAMLTNDPTISASVQYPSEPEDFKHRQRQTSLDSVTTLTTPSLDGEDSSLSPEAKTEAAEDAPRSREQTFSDMKFDTWMVRLGFAINSITYVGYGLATEGWVFYLATALHSICTISNPSLKSLLTYMVEPSQFGAVLGAFQIIDSIAIIFSPIVISWVYALTVGIMPEFVWYTCAAWAGICVVLSFMIRQKQFRNNMNI